MTNKLYTIRVDGFDIMDLSLKLEQCATHHDRDIALKAVAEHLAEPQHYFTMLRRDKNDSLRTVNLTEKEI